MFNMEINYNTTKSSFFFPLNIQIIPELFYFVFKNTF